MLLKGLVMKLNYKQLGNYIREVNVPNIRLGEDSLRGISSIKKQFVPSKANTIGINFNGYKVVEPKQFSYNPNTARMGDKIPIALNDSDNTYIVSKIYPVFEIIDLELLLPEYLLMWFKRKEFDRYARYHSWGSARETFSWNEMCDIKLPVPIIGEQKKYVALYNAVTRNQKIYEKSLDDLQLICDSFIESLIKTGTSQTLGNYISKVNERNSELKISLLRGVSTSRKLIKSKANTTDVNFSKHKILKRGQLVYVPDTTRRGDKIGLAINTGETCIVSNIYTIFRVTEPEILMPEFLFLWFKRQEFDRYARFFSWGSVRETFDWEEMCDVKLPIPDMVVQKSIVAMYHVLEKRKRINTELKDSVPKLSQVLMRGVVQELVCA
jgi:type I restriction enzyme, S subunit